MVRQKLSLLLASNKNVVPSWSECNLMICVLMRFFSVSSKLEYCLESLGPNKIEILLVLVEWGRAGSVGSAFDSDPMHVVGSFPTRGTGHFGFPISAP